MKKLFFLFLSAGLLLLMSCGKEQEILTDPLDNFITLGSGTTKHLLAVSSTTGTTVYVAGYGGTILKTVDGGSVWTHLNAGVSDHLYIAKFLGPLVGFVGGDNGTFLKTTDGGLNWKKITTPVMNFRGIYVFNENTIILCGTDEQIIKTADGGKNWSMIYTKPDDDVTHLHGDLTHLYGITFVDDRIGFAVSLTGDILKTIDSGNTWQRSHITSEGLAGIYFFNANEGYVVGDHGFIGKTSDGGQSWSKVNSGVSDFLTTIYFLDNDHGYIMGGNIINNTGLVLKTKDRGNTWVNQQVNSQRLYASDKILNSKMIGVGLDGKILRN